MTVEKQEQRDQAKAVRPAKDKALRPAQDKSVGPASDKGDAK